MTELEDVIRGWAELTEVEEKPTRWVRAKEPESVDFSTLEGETDGPPVELASASNKPWSNFKASDYTDEQWKRACLIHLEGSDKNPKSYCKLPVREPSGALNRNAMAAAAAALAGARGGLSVSSAEKKKAARALLALYKQIGEDPPESLSKMNFSAVDELPEDLQRYVDLERQLTGEEWLLAVVAREQGFLRLDLARESGVEVMDIDAGAETGAVT